MSEDKGFTVNDRRRVKMDESAVDTGEKAQTEEAGPGPGAKRPTQEGAGRRRQALPPVDFVGFALGLGQMALMHLGEIPEPGTGEVSRSLEQARHTIDILDMLEEKTRGNLTPEESNLLRTLKSELKLKYVKAADAEEPA